ncbi:MAG TPA: hypothetical protein PLO37_00565 [Candidatus Hydrogenedentes bacterium]|nr:hypothetical protein [Candidatus Hydrogenedentota bacterium]HPG65306.1 hypothetical protein [Candidatus Hydrogenedentota bacterium]
MEIKISRTAQQCTQCERAFEHEESLRSLVRIENQELTREDYCAACWEDRLALGAFSVWSPRYYDPKVAEQEPPETFSPLRRIFYDAAEAEGRAELARAYLAAQLLRRQKVFRLIKESSDPDAEVRVALFVDRLSSSLVEVRDPNLTYEELAAARITLMEALAKLENGEAKDGIEAEPVGDVLETDTASVGE